MTEYLIRSDDRPAGEHCGVDSCVPCAEAARTGSWVDRAVSQDAVVDAVRQLVADGADTITVTRRSS